MDKRERVTISIPAIAAEIGNNCNPRITNIKINFHYYGGDAVSIVATGVPDYKVEVVVDQKDLQNAMNFMDDRIIEANTAYKKQVIDLRRALREANDQIKELTKKPIV